MRGIAPSASVPKGLLRFVLLLVAACLVGALVGIVTEPFSTGRGNAAALRADLASAAPVDPAPDTKSSTDPASEGSENRPPKVEPNPDAAALAALAARPQSPRTEPVIAKDGGDNVDPTMPRAKGAQALVDHLKPDFTGLAVVGALLAAFGVIAFVLAKKNRLARANNGVVHLVDSLHIGPGRSVHLLRCEGRKFLIGNSERGIHFLASVPQNEVERSLDAVVADDVTSPHEGEPTFESLLAGSARR